MQYNYDLAENKTDISFWLFQLFNCLRFYTDMNFLFLKKPI